jgi:hypothetical protein
MKKRRKNPNAVALGRLGGSVRSEAKQRANRENGRKDGWSRAAKRGSLPAATRGVRDPVAARNHRNRDRCDPRAVWTAVHSARQCWDPIFHSRLPLTVGGLMQELLTSRSEGRPERYQLSFLCACGKRLIELKTLGCCRRCYDRRYHSLRLFGGMRERVLERDRFRCRVCGARQRLLIHHRDRHNEPKVLVTLCSRCHVRIHRSLGVRHWLSGLLLKLWREPHRHEPMQLRLALGPARTERTENTFDQTDSTVLAPLPVGRENRRRPIALFG